MPKLIALLVALASGVAMAVQGGLNAALGKITGLMEATFIVHATAAIATAAVLLVHRSGDGSLAKALQAPWPLWLGGLIGVFITYGVVVSIPRVGAALATTAIVVGQVTTAMIIDHLGLFGLERLPCSWTQIAGLALLAAGGWLMLR